MDSIKWSDAELGAALREKASGCGYSPGALLEFAAHCAEHHRRTVMPSQHFTRNPESGWNHHAELVDELVFQESDVESLPLFIASLIKEGHRIDEWIWNDGVRVVRLLDSRGLVLGARILSP